MGDDTVRMHQANERTMLAWMRTAIALMAFGFAIARFGVFLHEAAAIEHLPPARGAGSGWVGEALVACGMLASLIATVRYKHVRDAILRGEVGAPSGTTVYAFGAFVTLIGAAMLVLLLRVLAG